MIRFLHFHMNAKFSFRLFPPDGHDMKIEGGRINYTVLFFENKC